jgi:hypothetical protein
MFTECSLNVPQDGDWVIAGSDGLFDNMFDKEIAALQQEAALKGSEAGDEYFTAQVVARCAHKGWTQAQRGWIRAQRVDSGSEGVDSGIAGVVSGTSPGCIHH